MADPFAGYVPPVQYPGGGFAPPQQRAPQQTLMQQLAQLDADGNNTVAGIAPPPDSAAWGQGDPFAAYEAAGAAERGQRMSGQGFQPQIVSQADSLNGPQPPPLQGGVPTAGFDDVNDPRAAAAAYGQAAAGPGMLAAANPADAYYANVIAPQEQAQQPQGMSPDEQGLQNAAYGQQFQDAQDRMALGMALNEPQNAMNVSQPVYGDPAAAYADWLDVGNAGGPQEQKVEDYGKTIDRFRQETPGFAKQESGLRTRDEQDRLDKEDKAAKGQAWDTLGSLMGPAPRRNPTDPALGSGGRRYQ